MNIFHSIDEAIGNTPLFRLHRIEKAFNLSAELYAKAEFFNPASSIKDRVALHMLNAAEEQGLLTAGATVIEPTSGNTGIGLAAIGAARGYRVIIVMPDSMSPERQQLMRAYGAHVVLTPGKEGMEGTIRRARELASSIEGSFIPSQFDNPANPNAHYYSTAVEIWDALNGSLDVFVAGIGTGGTVSGCAKYFKERNSAIQIIGVEPYDSPLLSCGRSGTHTLQGIGANFIPQTLDLSLINEIVTVEDKDARDIARLIAAKEGLLVGISAGAALSAAISVAKRTENSGKRIVTVLPDTGEHYLSTNLFE